MLRRNIQVFTCGYVWLHLASGGGFDNGLKLESRAKAKDIKMAEKVTQSTDAANPCAVNSINRRHETTDELAARLRVKPATIRHGLCANGHYMGMRPVKLPNRRLLWDAAQAEAIING